MKAFVKQKTLKLKTFYWSCKINSLTDGTYLPSENIKRIDTFKKKNFGAPNDDEYFVWSNQCCGITSMKMLTDHLGVSNKKSIYQMTQDSRAFHTFKVSENYKSHNDIKGIFHKGLAKYAKSFGLNSYQRSIVPIEQVIYLLTKNYYFLASVNIYDIWQDKEKRTGAGLHIVLVVGFEKKNKNVVEIYYKDPSSSRKWNKETDIVGFNLFRSKFNHRGVFIKHPNLPKIECNWLNN